MDDEIQAAMQAAMLDEIVAYTSPPSLAENEFTLYDYMDRVQETTGERPSRTRARNRLQKMLDNGLLDKRRVYYKERWYVAFWLTEKGKEKLSDG